MLWLQFAQVFGAESTWPAVIISKLTSVLDLCHLIQQTIKDESNLIFQDSQKMETENKEVK